MSKLVYGELRLVDVLREAQVYMREMKELHSAALITWNSLSTIAKNDHKELKAMLDKYPKVKAGLKAELIAAHAIVNHIEGHIKWKAAVREVFGEDGLKRCYDAMQKITEQEELLMP